MRCFISQSSRDVVGLDGKNGETPESHAHLQIVANFLFKNVDFFNRDSNKNETRPPGLENTKRFIFQPLENKGPFAPRKR